MFQIRQKSPHPADGSLLIYTLLTAGEQYSMVVRGENGELVIKPTCVSGSTKHGYIGDKDGTLVQLRMGLNGSQELYCDIDDGEIWDWIIKIIESGEYVVTIRNNEPLALSMPDELFAD